MPGGDPSDTAAAITIIEQVLEAAVVSAGGVKLRPATSEQLAIDVVEALEQQGFDIIRN